MDQYAELAQKLKPYIVKWKLTTSTTDVVVTTPTPSTLPWSSINFAGSSLSDIISRPHSVLTGLLSDDHTQYVRQEGRSGYAFIDSYLRVRDITSNRYISDHYLAGSSGTFLTSFDSTGLAYLPLYLDANPINFRPGGVAGLSLASSSIWYSGINSINTNNYVSQTTGMHFGYDGSIDCQYLYAGQLHAKAFIADLEQALAGAQIITKSVTILDQAFSAPFPGFSAALTVKDLPSAHGMQVFQANDYIRLRQFSRAGGSLSISDCWGQATSPTDNGNGTQTWTFTRSGTATYATIAQTGLASNRQSSSTTAVLTKPAGWLSGHFAIATLAYAGSPTVTPPSGWTLHGTQTSGSITLAIYYKLLGGSEPSTYTFTFSVATNVSLVGTAYSNVWTTVLIDATNGQSNASSTSMSVPGVTPRTPAGMLLFYGAVANDIRATPPSGMTEQFDLGIGSTSVYLATQLLSSGAATGTKTATLTSAAVNSAVQLLLIPSLLTLSTEAGQMAPTATIAADAIVLDYGVSGNGYAEVTTVDGVYGANSPYYQIVTWTTHPATGQSLKMRLGNLAGVTDTSLSPTGYGLYSSNAFLTGVFVAGGGYYRVDSNGANISALGAVDWSLAGGHQNISLSSYQSYSFSDSNGYFGGMAGGSASTYDRVVIYNQQQYIDKEAQIILDARTVSHDVLGNPTYDRDAIVTLAASKWFPDSGVVNSATIEVRSSSVSPGDAITLTADAIIFDGGIEPPDTTTNGVEVNMPTGNTGYAFITYYGANYRGGYYNRSNLNLWEMASADLGNGVAGPSVWVGYNTNATVAAAGTINLKGRTGGANFLWVDASNSPGVLRINTTAPTTALSDTSGSVVGAQTSWIFEKENVSIIDNTDDMLDSILAVDLYGFQMKGDGQRTYGEGKPAYKGIVITEADRENNAWFASGLGEGQMPSLNERNLFGYLIGAIQAQQKQIVELQAALQP